MKIITWNVNGIRACGKKGLGSFIRKEDPDLLCLQETKAHRDQVEEDLRAPEGRLSFWSSSQRPGYSGVVTFARNQPLAVRQGIGIRKFDSEGRFVVTDHGAFLLYNVYFPNGGSGSERHEFKQEFLVRFRDHLEEVYREGREIILVGDYNVAYLDIDVYDPSRLSAISGFLPEERTWFREFLSGSFVDTFRLLHPEQKDKYTWWSMQERGRIGNRGWRIDHVCVTKGLKGRIQRAEILDEVMGSDHCPVLVELDI